MFFLNSNWAGARFVCCLCVLCVLCLLIDSMSELFDIWMCLVGSVGLAGVFVLGLVVVSYLGDGVEWVCLSLLFCHFDVRLEISSQFFLTVDETKAHACVVSDDWLGYPNVLRLAFPLLMLQKDQCVYWLAGGNDAWRVGLIEAAARAVA